MNNNSGLSITANCLMAFCPFHRIPLHFYLGFGWFDIGTIKTVILCGSCKNVVGEISNLTFRNCLWKYEGTRNNQEEVKPKIYLALTETAYFPCKDSIWNTLLVHAWQPSEINDSHIERKDASVQTKTINAISDTIVSALAEEAQYYRNKYLSLKEKTKILS